VLEIDLNSVNLNQKENFHDRGQPKWGTKMAHPIRESLNAAGRGEAFIDAFLEGYLIPAFGARSKSEVDLLVFTALVHGGAVDPERPLYDLARSLNITPARTRTLVLNWQLRSADLARDLTDKLISVLQKTRFGKDGSFLTFGVESPLLREEIIARLKRRGVFADASFQKDLVRLPVDAFVEFFDDLLPIEVKTEVRERLIRDKQLPDKSFKALAIGVLGKLGEKVIGEVAKDLAGGIVEGAGKHLVEPAADRVGAFLTGLLRGDTSKAVDAIEHGEFLDMKVA
jgi:hypothetical protein